MNHFTHLLFLSLALLMSGVSGCTGGKDSSVSSSSDSDSELDTNSDRDTDLGKEGSTSAGCGSSNPLASGNFFESIDGANRSWILDVPSDYDANNPYRMIFVWHPLMGSASGVASGQYDGLKPLSNGSTIFVAPDGQDGSNFEVSGHGWWNENGSDMKLFEAIFSKITENLCVDMDRVFTTGFSFGAMMSYTIPFEFDVFRATAPASGKIDIIPYEAKYDYPIPIMAIHGDADTFVATHLGRQFLDKYATERNGCSAQTQPTDPSPCIAYQDCSVQTLWCEFSGGHNPWSGAPEAIWNFFSQF